MTIAFETRSATSASKLLEVTKLSKRFGGTQALSNVDMTLLSGEVHALLGENGAGKSTLIKILSGMYSQDEGMIEGPSGQTQPGRPLAGIAFVHQDLGLSATATVAENIAFGTGFPMKAGMINWNEAIKRARSALDVLDSRIDPKEYIGRLSAAEKSIVAIARAIAIDAQVIVLDEPTATLPYKDVETLHNLLIRLKSRGFGILYVTHRLDEVFRLADRATILRDGKLVVTDDVKNLTPRRLMNYIAGRELDQIFPKGDRSYGRDVLTVTDICINDVGPASFSVRAGEVVGLVGLQGAGHETIGRGLFGDRKIASGEVRIDGRSVRLTSPLAAMEAGIGFVSSKRVEESIAIALSLQENVFVNPKIMSKASAGSGAEFNAAVAALKEFGVKPPNPKAVMASLSGGNQQKVVMSRWMLLNRRLLILEEPTIGVDVGAKSDIYAILEKALKKGLAVILISTDFEEVAGLADRAIVFSRGKPVASIESKRLSAGEIASISAGVIH